MKNKLLLSLLLLMVFCTAALAQHVVPVTYFGKNGTFMRIVNDAYVDARYAVVQPDGKLLFAITSDDDFSYSTQQLLYRLNKNGEPDASFGNKGIIEMGRPIPLDGPSWGGFFDLQPDGKIVAANVNVPRNEGRPPLFIVERFLPDGTRDSSFSKDGYNAHNYNRAYLGVRGLKVKPDGKILVLGTINFAPALIQFTENGLIDTTFGDGGAYLNFAPYEQNVQYLLALPNNQFIIASVYQKSDNNFGTCVTVHNADGTVDSTKGTNGSIFFDNNTTLQSIGLELQKDNKLLVYTTDNVNNTVVSVLFRLKADGTTDTGFGDNGSVITGPFSTYMDYHVPHEVKVQQNGRIIVNNPQQLQRYLANGSIDSTFGTNGILAEPSLSISLVFALNENRLYATGTDNYPHVIVNAYKYCNACIADTSNELLNARPKAPESNYNAVKLYPNPVSSQLMVSGLKAGIITQLQLTDVTGRVLQKATTQSATYQWNIQSLPNGIYYLSIIRDKALPATYKVIKQ